MVTQHKMATNVTDIFNLTVARACLDIPVLQIVIMFSSLATIVLSQYAIPGPANCVLPVRKFNEIRMLPEALASHIPAVILCAKIILAL